VRWTLTPSGSRLRSRLAGHHASGLGRVRFTRRVDDPRAMPGYVFEHLLREHGVKVSGGVHIGGTDEKRRVAYVGSPPLRTLLHRVGKNSDNFYAEMILKALGGQGAGHPATSAAGAEQVVDWLRRSGASLNGVQIINGSGLFDANRVSPQVLTHALRTAWLDPMIGVDFMAQLAIGGVDGTLRSRFRELRYRVRAKTGTLRSVSALSGYALRRSGPPIAFSMIVEGLPSHHPTSRARMDELVSSLLK
jgi:D-alanyl-D-alanine carboxypeptidase/D-alanyl-D-alanine-endopeptidase (penicillin-binding protein 4)